MVANDVHYDPASVVFPLPYRVFFLIGVGLLGWATNLHGLYKLDVDVVGALELRTEGYQPRLPLTNHRRPSLIGQSNGSARSNTFMATPTFYQSLYRLILTYSGICLVSWTLFRASTGDNPSLVDAYGYIPALTALIMVFILLTPYNIFFREERAKFIQAIRRCFLSSMNTPIQFSDVILADIGTSFSKVIGDVWLSLCMIIPGNTILNPPPQVGLARWILPTLMSFPYLARFRQCVIEYNLSSNESTRPLFNAIKYATAFPVIYLSAAQSLVVADLVQKRGDTVLSDPWHGEHRLFRLWLLAVFVNSFYSFWWDVTNDWGLELLKPEPSVPQERQPPKRLILPRLHSSTPLISRETSPASDTERDRSPRISESSPTRGRSRYGLRQILLFPAFVYPLFIVVNLMLRMAWTVRLAAHPSTTRDGSMTVFWMEVAEITRRWLWVFVRVEWEVIKKIGEGEPQADPDYLYSHPPSSSESLSARENSPGMKE
ncbi:hypothetical protein CC1G_03227 [Coprinopsis cinerea okayama7|uniref:EXS domain-containing protein n=1 Tax=Coprinopsis cinerea (strain Okayama-7 / 130 / ATCC MYA-4618 / FGSC 9003) TaxID=240176 RepID=A8N784_COPC7|nr:hypothetical protein CC1G_03227 [Coprinopsis cinerea okayama7\|eukprot:XP_001830690.2 hypothetical protein CC1G_03227 [Coprinopsis cinerea okayama7\